MRSSRSRKKYKIGEFTPLGIVVGYDHDRDTYQVRVCSKSNTICELTADALEEFGVQKIPYEVKSGYKLQSCLYDNPPIQPNKIFIAPSHAAFIFYTDHKMTNTETLNPVVATRPKLTVKETNFASKYITLKHEANGYNNVISQYQTIETIIVLDFDEVTNIQNYIKAATKADLKRQKKVDADNIKEAMRRVENETARLKEIVKNTAR